MEKELITKTFKLYEIEMEVKVDLDNNEVKLKDGRLADLAPTMLDIMGLEKPAEMTGESLLINA